MHAILCEVAASLQRSATENIKDVDDAGVCDYLIRHLLSGPSCLRLQWCIDGTLRGHCDSCNRARQYVIDDLLLHLVCILDVEWRRCDEVDCGAWGEAFQKLDAKVIVVLLK